MYSYDSTMALPCRACGKGFQETDRVHTFEDRRFHEWCYFCNMCKKKFSEVGTVKPGNVRGLPYCHLCFPKANVELCGGCDEPIGNKFLKVQGIHKKFHQGCFKCSKCGTALTTAFRKRKGEPECVTCPDPNLNAEPDSAVDTSTTDNDAPSAKFCGECGAKRAEASAKFCGECGNKY